MFIAALFTIAKTWKQPKYPSTDEWINVKHIYLQWNPIHSKNPIHLKKNEIMPFEAKWMDLEIIILNEVSQKENNKYYMI